MRRRGIRQNLTLGWLLLCLFLGAIISFILDPSVFVLILGLLVIMFFGTMVPMSMEVISARSDYSRATTTDEQELLDLLDKYHPSTKGLYQVRLNKLGYIWKCTVISKILSVPFHCEVSTWGSKPNMNMMAKQLAGPLEWFTPQAKAYVLAEKILGQEGVQRVISGGYFLKSKISPMIDYRFLSYTIVLYKNGRPLGSFCLQASGRYPLWDVVLSRILMAQGSELEFLMTAHFFGPVPPYFAVPMTREQFVEIYGKENLRQWDSFTSLTLERVTLR